MDYSEKYGNSIDEAVELALKDLKVSKDEVEIEVLEQPSKGFLGFGSKLAKVRVSIKTQAPKVEEVKEEIKFAGAYSMEALNESKTRAPKKAAKKERPKKKEVKEVAVVATTLPDDKSITKRPDDLVVVEEGPATDFLKALFESMHLELETEMSANNGNIYIDIEGKDAGTIIGKRGQTLDAVQYLTSLVVNKGREDYVRVVLDAENYREKREKALVQLSLRLANKVAKSGRYVRLEPMNPYERMVIHATLQDDNRVVTRSEGSEPFRKVIIDINK